MSHSTQEVLAKLPIRSHARKGWKPDFPDARDHKFSAERIVKLAHLPPSVDLRAHCPPVYDQGQIGSCTANALGGNFEFLVMKEKIGTPFIPSRLFIYYNERVIEQDVPLDAGAQLRDGIKTLNKLGVCPETMWPYDGSPADPNNPSDNQFQPGARAATQPSTACYTAALKNKVTSYMRVAQNLDQMRGCLASGYPIVVGFNTYTSFDGDGINMPPWYATAVVPMPDPSEQQNGGHAVCLVGYDDSKQAFLFRNSWGASWGPNGGYGWIPYNYLTNPGLSSDFWTMRIVT